MYTSAASIRCWIRRPDGPAAVSLGKDLSMARMLRSRGMGRSISGTIGTVGQALLGCLLTNNCQVTSLLGATPEETRAWHALPYKPS